MYKESNTIPAILINIALLYAYQKLIDQYKVEENSSIKKKLNTYKLLVNRHTVSVLPKIRKNYAKVLGTVLWEHDITVSVSGKANKILVFTGVIFASNKNIKDIQESLKDTPELLRFNQIHYHWSKYAQTYTCFTLNTPPDSNLYVIR